MEKSSSNELKRMEQMVKEVKENHLRTWNGWTSLLRSLTNERGPWESGEKELHWKLDLTETKSRMRMKMRRNYNFDNHANCTHSSLKNKVEQAVLEKSESEYELLEQIKKIPKIPLVGEFTEDKVVLPPPQAQIDKSEAETSEKQVLECEAELILPLGKKKGTLRITTTHIYFKQASQESSNEGSLLIDKKWPISRIREVHLRRHLLRRSALEFFLLDKTNFLLNFLTKDRNKVYQKLISLKPPNLINSYSGSPEEILAQSGMTELWLEYKISNFDYLMFLNTISGRTYNDLSQYPIFPWVLQDYTSSREAFKLNDPNSYRDLSKPIGETKIRNHKKLYPKNYFFLQVLSTQRD